MNFVQTGSRIVKRNGAIKYRSLRACTICYAVFPTILCAACAINYSYVDADGNLIYQETIRMGFDDTGEFTMRSYKYENLGGGEIISEEAYQTLAGD